MRTTLDLPDPLYRRLKLKAALEGRTLRELVIRYLEAGLAQEALAKEPPILPPAGRKVPHLSRTELAELLDED